MLTVGVATVCVVELDPRSVPSEREIGAARAPTASSSPCAVVALVTELATAVVDAATVVATASERGVAGATSMRAATMAVSAAVATDVIE